MQPICREIVGVDLDMPAFSVWQAGKILKTNGLQRAVKTAIRITLFERQLWMEFHKRMHSERPEYKPGTVKLVVGNAAGERFWSENPGPYDFIFSEDVFEHIPPQELEVLVGHMYRNLADRGVCVILPLVFTGVCGGHEVDAYPSRVGDLHPGRAWRHLREERFVADTYLNRLPRSAYKELFGRQFEVLEDKAVMGRLGEKYLTEALRQELAEFDDYELFSNKVQFVLARR